MIQQIWLTMTRGKGPDLSPHNQITPSNYRPDIQWLRAFAVLSVLLYHAGEKIIPNGYLGVDVFFVVSGFVVAPLIERIFLNERISARFRGLNLFYLKRFWRLAPTMGFVIGISSLLIILLASPSEHWRIAQQAFYSLIIAGNVGAIKFSGDYFSPTPNPFIHLWSLSVEEQIYILLPLLCFSLSLVMRKNVFKLSTLAILGSFSFVLFLSPRDFFVYFRFLGFTSEVDFMFYSAFTRFWQFAVGAILFLISRRMPKLKFPGKVRATLILAMLLVLLTPLSLVPKFGTMLITLITLMALIPSSKEVKWTSLSKTLVWFGNRSYSIYLVHMPILYLAKYSPALEIPGQESRAIQSALGLLLSILLGALVHRTVEHRSREFGKIIARGHTKQLQFLSISLVIPIGLLILLNYGARSNYFGLMHDLNKPQYAGHLDPQCARDSESGPPCLYRNPGAQDSVLLIGDSHAGQYSEALIRAARYENWNSIVWTKSSCSFVVDPTMEGQVSESCLSRNRKILEWVAREKPKLVIVSQYIYAEWDEGGARNAISLLKRLVPKVIVVENNPIFPDEKDFMVSRPIIMRPYQPPKKFPVSEMNYADSRASEVFTAWAEDSGFETLRVNSYFCDAHFCSRFDMGKWLFVDDDHLSVSGAKRLIPKLRQIIASA